jgi:hypothetical protein
LQLNPGSRQGPIRAFDTATSAGTWAGLAAGYHSGLGRYWWLPVRADAVCARRECHYLTGTTSWAATWAGVTGYYCSTLSLGARSSWCIVAMMRKLPSATVALVCWSTRRFKVRPHRGPARFAF